MVSVDDIAVSVITEIEEQPTAFDAEKVVEQLENAENYYYDDKLDTEGNLIMFKSIEQEVAIEIVKRGIVSDDDVCEWHKTKNNNTYYKCNTHAEIHDSRVLDWCKCPYCGKKIKVVE